MQLRTWLAATAGLLITAGAALAEDVINAVHFAPTQSGYTQSFLKFVDKLNERGKGVVRIDVKGGPEVVPNPQLGTAQQSGLIDMINAAAGLYLEIVPEGDVLAATSKTPWEQRENGGWDLLDSIYQKKGNAKLLAHVDGGAGFHIWTVEEPKLKEDGGLDTSSLIVRSSPLYKSFLESTGAKVVVQPASEVYTSLERGVVNANAYSVLGYSSFGWDKFTKYRVDPSFLQTDVLVTMNLDKWNALSPEAQKIVQDVAIEYERESYDANLAETERLNAEMEKNGLKPVEMTGAGREAFLAGAAKASWARLESRDPTNVAELRKLFE